MRPRSDTEQAGDRGNTLYLKYCARLGVSHSLGWLARLVIAAAAYVLIVG